MNSKPDRSYPKSGKNRSSTAKRNPKSGPKGGTGPASAKKKNFFKNKKPFHQRNKKQPLPTTYDVVFFATLSEAERSVDRLKEKKKPVDQLNIVIEAEGVIEKSVLLEFASLYYGNAWTIIHKRRVEDGWYKDRAPKPKEKPPEESLDTSE